ncbi:MAG: DNA-binding protein [Gallionellales bacterium 35-53-114]|jgi:Rrf2 family iron-sulfur cluster assembly transcriptional regulator|nr:MAG: DNA-binding protein [Gallionellales bacterium 35-53-114]OYZ64156.1 MAG: DNA-binding protein [Gallionellales bacterium 24-53-125]OZB10535.1 MAG: DNA-binding protein [Gallionellales bacterium 39-52-133]HQS57155.1 Rrf2 family transcriptional regulator [Gallionellaceae bacterium]HQS74657.1 Rrf2 family transcriptional regulator [Gallionellaceae bacterium]
MRLTTKGRFAVTAMADLAERHGNGPVTLASISERQKISLSYLEQLFGKLRKHNIVIAVRGPGGGYYLARPASMITVADIIVAVDEHMDATQCGGKGNCDDNKQCSTHDLWMGLNEILHKYMAEFSLQQLVDNHAKAGTAAVPVTMNLGKSNAKPVLASV